MGIVSGSFCWVVFYFVLPQTLCFNFTSAVNSAVHLWGEEPYRDAMSSPCRSKNNALLWFCLVGENWHNNHHAFPSSATTQIEWYEVDLVFVVYKLLEALGLAWRHKEKAIHPEAIEYQRFEGYEVNVSLQVLQLGTAFLALTGMWWWCLDERTPKSAHNHRCNVQKTPSYTTVSAKEG